MGGCFAVDVSQRLPKKVAMVISLGSPFGDPRGTSMWSIMRKLNRSEVPEDAMNFDGWMEKRHIKTKNLPIHVIYSEKDGIVGVETAQLCAHKDVSYTSIGSSHIGFAYNVSVYHKVIDIIEKAATAQPAKAKAPAKRQRKPKAAKA